MTTDKYIGSNYDIERTTDGQFFLVHPTELDQLYDLFDELVAIHPVCEEARSWAEGEPMTKLFGEDMASETAILILDETPWNYTDLPQLRRELRYHAAGTKVHSAILHAIDQAS